MAMDDSTFVIELDTYEQLAIVAAAFTFLALVVLILVCSLSPFCLCYNCCPFNEPHKPAPNTAVYGSTDGTRLYRPSIMKDKPTAYWHTMGTLKESDMSDSLSDAGTGDVIELRQERVKKTFSKYSSSSSTGSASPTPHIHHDAKLSFTLMYDRVDNNLNIKVQQLSNFNATDPDGATAPYVKVKLYRVPKNFFTFRGKLGKDNSSQNLDVEMQTKIQRRVDDPVFNETFTASIDQHEISNYTLKLLVCDFDRYTRHIVVGEVLVNLSSVDWLTQTEIKFTEPLQPAIEENLGELYLSLMFLPTAEKLTVTIIKAQGLKVIDSQRNTTDAFVKVVLMYDGRQMKKSKTAVVAGDINPVYNESITFDVPQFQLDKVYVSVSVIHQDKGKEKKTLIGRLYLGTNFDNEEREQWIEMMQNPRKQVMCWHRLQN